MIEMNKIDSCKYKSKCGLILKEENESIKIWVLRDKNLNYIDYDNNRNILSEKYNLVLLN